MSALPFTSSEYLKRQEIVLDGMPDNSVLVIPTNRKAVRSNDVNYPFRPSSYIMYLCGWTEPDGIFLARKSSSKISTVLFVKPRETKSEIWEGIRVGLEGALDGWPIDKAASIDDLNAELAPLLDGCNQIFSINGQNNELDSILNEHSTVSDARILVDKHRVIKSDREIEIMTEASAIASEAHIRAIGHSFPGIGEWQIQSIIESHFTHSESQWSYPSIVGGGDNATILHYKENNCKIDDGEMVLVDAGCEVHGYASDITRTWPVNGKFSEAQREIYELVLKAELAGIEACQPGAPWLSMHRATSLVLAEGLIELGILDCTIQEAIGEGNDFNGPYRDFFMHGTGHFLGLDVHDVGGGRQGDDDPGPALRHGMVVTVEPGLYFGSWRTDVNIPSRYAGIGVRIEDDVLITDSGPVVLSAGCPKEIEEIEALVGKLR